MFSVMMNLGDNTVGAVTDSIKMLNLGKNKTMFNSLGSDGWG